MIGHRVRNRLLFVAATMLVFAGLFPIASTPLICAVIFTIPVSYAYFIVPALVSGFFFAISMLLLKSRFALGSKRACLLGFIIGSICNYAWLASFKLDKAFFSMVFRETKTSDEAMQQTIVSIILWPHVPFLFTAGIVCAAFIRGDRWDRWIGNVRPAA